MNYDATFPCKIDEVRDRVSQWAQDIAKSKNRDPELRRALAELSVTLEELSVADAELRQQNEELIRSQADLHEERERYHDLFDNAPDGYFVTDSKGIILEANKVAGHLLKIAPPYLVSKNLLNFLEKNDRRVARIQLLQLHQTQRCTDWVASVLPRASASFFASITLLMVKGASAGNGQRPVSIRWLMRDISERVLAEMQIRALNEHLEHSHHQTVAELKHSKMRDQEFLDQKRLAREVSEENVATNDNGSTQPGPPLPND